MTKRRLDRWWIAIIAVFGLAFLLAIPVGYVAISRGPRWLACRDLPNQLPGVYAASYRLDQDVCVLYSTGSDAPYAAHWNGEAWV